MLTNRPRIDIADQPKVDDFTAGHGHGCAPMSLHEPAVDTADADRRDAELAARREQSRIDQAVQHHAGRIDRGRIGDAATLHHAGLDAEPRRDLVELRTTAVHQHHAYAEVVQDRDLLDERAHRHRIAKGAAARLDHEHLALVHVDVRRRAAQRAHRDRLFHLVSNHWPAPPSRRYNTAICTTIRFAASSMTRLCGPSSTSSATATLRRTGRQCMK